MSEPALPGAVELTRMYASGDLSPADAVTDAIGRIERLQPRLNAFRFVEDDAALLAQARAAEERWRSGAPLGALDGVPVAIKDTFPVEGWSTLRGSRAAEPSPACRDTPVVARLRRAGGIFIGRTTTSEFGWKGVTDSPLTGVTRNPWDPARTPGGSSGGSAVAVATGMAAVALGNDGGGSVRIPAAFTGTVGLKATHGRVPVWPGSVLGELAHTGPMTRTVADAAAVLDLVAGPDPLDWTAPPPGVGFTACLAEGVAGLRVAVLADTAADPCDPAVAPALRRVGRLLEDLGARVEEVALPFADPVDAFETIWYAGMRHLVDALAPAQRKLVDPELRRHVVDLGDVAVGELFRAQAAVIGLRETMGRFHERYDVLVTPTVPITPFEAGVLTPPGSRLRSWTSWTPLTYPFNLTQQPAISIPIGQGADGLPIGGQVVASKHRDDLVLRTAYAVERAAPAGRTPST